MDKRRLAIFNVAGTETKQTVAINSDAVLYIKGPPETESGTVRVFFSDKGAGVSIVGEIRNVGALLGFDVVGG